MSSHRIADCDFRAPDWVCPVCGTKGKEGTRRNCKPRRLKVRPAEDDRPAASLRHTPPIPQHGPGTELKHLLAELKITEKIGCGCNALIVEMNALGVEGCRLPENRDRILAAMRGKLPEWGLVEKLRAGILAAWNGVPLSLEGLYDEAVRRAEARVISSPSA